MEEKEIELTIDIDYDIQKPSYFAIIPAVVRYDKTLSDKEKLFYAEISSLCNVSGICTASNEYFKMLYEISDSTVSRAIAGLKKNGYIDTREKRFASKGNIKVLREIWLTSKAQNILSVTKEPKKPRASKEKVSMYSNGFITMKESAYDNFVENYGADTVNRTIEKMKDWCTKKQEFSKDYGQRLGAWLAKLPKLKDMPIIPTQEEEKIEPVEVFIAQPIF